MTENRKIPVKIKDAVIERDKGVCADCGRDLPIGHGRDALQIHHIVPFLDGGGHTLDNLILVCGACHTKRDKAHWRKFYDAAMENVRQRNKAKRLLPKPARKTEDGVRITLRLPKSLHERLVEAAQHERRCLNNEMLSLLEESLRVDLNVQPGDDAEVDSPNSLGTVMTPLKERGYKRVNDPRKKG